MKVIALTCEKSALVDDADFERISSHKWHAHKGNSTWYAVRNVTVGKKKQFEIKMHRLLLSAPIGSEVDHINGNGLDNRRCNLRLVSHRENGQNRHHPRTSRFPGVSWHKASNKWRATITIGKTKKHLGIFNIEEDASKAYTAAANELRWRNAE